MEAKNTTRELVEKQTASDHLANERTMLAWVRTGIGIIAFGFAVVKFSLFIRQIALALGNDTIHPRGYSSEIGIALVALGTLTILLSYLRYRRTELQLNSGAYRHSPLLIQLLTGLIFLIGLLLLIYLVLTGSR
ncbi:MAG: DUF202 domain-containing protein [Bacteroidetes bacterium]|nr:DUF202 domain-containing protein [Bacteroidota bacterium]